MTAWPLFGRPATLAGRRGQVFFTMMAAFAELERDIIHERTMAGLAAAKLRVATAAVRP